MEDKIRRFDTKKKAQYFIRKNLIKFYQGRPYLNSDGKWVIMCLGGRFVRISGLVL